MASISIPPWCSTEQLNPIPPEALPDLQRLADKVLFGSDYPNIPYPYPDAVAAVISIGLGEQWCRKVLYANAATLFGLG